MLFCSLYDGPLLSSFLSFLFPIMPRFPVTTCPTNSYLKSDTWQSQLIEIYILDTLFEIKNFACYSFRIGVTNRCLILKEARG